MKTSTVLGTTSQRVSPLTGLLERLFAAIKSVRIERRERRLRLCESLALGDKRSVAVVEFEEQRFLLAITSSSISLLQSLGPTTSAGDDARAERA
jgi:flagellar biogenesis protein FliO